MVSALDWSTTPASNTTLGGEAVSNTMATAKVDDLSRILAAGVKSALLDTGGATASTGSANAYLFASNGYVTALSNGAELTFKANFSNSGASTLAVDALGAKAIRKFTASGEAALATGDIISGMHYTVQYNTALNGAAGAWILLNPTVGGNFQPLDAQLTDVAGLTPTDNGVIVGNGTNFVVESGATLKTSLGLTIGTNVQPWDADLDTLAGLAKTDGNFIVGNGTAWVAESGATALASIGGAAASHSHAASAITSGTLVHERGGLEADVSAYDGLTRITGGATSAVPYVAETAWTPRIDGTGSAGAGTYSTQEGYYQRIGSMVFFTGVLVWSAHTGSGNMNIEGLPINISRFGACYVTWSSLSFTGVVVGTVMSSSNPTQIGLRNLPTTTAASAVLALDTAATLVFSGFYFA